jgi:hypothetical protein
MLRLKSRLAEDSTELAQIRVVRKEQQTFRSPLLGRDNAENRLDPWGCRPEASLLAKRESPTD